jgi:hypothetical protein
MRRQGRDAGRETGGRQGAGGARTIVASTAAVSTAAVSTAVSGARARQRAGAGADVPPDRGRAHPGFRPVATFYVNHDPFGDPGGSRTLPWLHAHRFDIGNRTLDHADLRTSTADTVRSEIVRCDEEIRRAAPDAAPVTPALPYGLPPRQPASALRGSGYDYRGAFLVGANPALSPFRSPVLSQPGTPRASSAVSSSTPSSNPVSRSFSAATRAGALAGARPATNSCSCSSL